MKLGPLHKLMIWETRAGSEGIDLRKKVSQGGNNVRPPSICDEPEAMIRAGLVFSLAVLAGVAGALPHLFFRYDFGDEAFFQGAWDESFYALVMSGEISDWNSYPARYMSEFLLNAAGGPSPLFATLSDIIWPALVMLTAGVLVLLLTRGALIVIPAVFLIVFSSDILSFNSSVIHAPSVTISNFLRELPLELRRLFSDPYVSFLYLFRTPEPQLSLSIFLAYLAVMVRFMRLSVPRAYDWLAVAVVSLVCTTAYVFFALGGLMIGAAGCFSLVLVRRWVQAAGLTAITALCGVWLGSRLLNSHADEADAMVFASSLPMLAPSLLYGGVLAITFAWSFRRTLAQDPALIFALCCFLLPFATLNQQVISGVMVQTLNWERYVNFPCLALGFLLFAERIDWADVRARTSSRFRQSSISSKYQSVFTKWALCIIKAGVSTRILRAVLLASVLFLCGLFLFRVQLNSYQQFVGFNVLTASYARLIDKVYAARPNAPRRIILANMAYDAAVRARVKTTGLVFNGYTSLLASLGRSGIKVAGGVQNEQAPSTFRTWGFDYATRLGLTSEKYEKKLKAEIDAGVCWPHLMYEATFLECAPFVSDFRLYFPEKLKQRVPSISKAYRHYLLKAKLGIRGEALLLLEKRSDAFDPNGLWRLEPLDSIKLSTASNGFAPSASVELFAYWQKPK